DMAPRPAVATAQPVQQDRTEFDFGNRTAVVETERPRPPKAASAPRRWRRRPLMAVAAALLLIGIAIPLGWWLGATVLRVETASGTLLVEINDDETEARVKGGKLGLTGPDDKVRYTLAPGERDAKIDAG